MATLADLRARIADDLDRSDLMTQIDAAIRDAVEHYESERFVFNETANATATFSSGVQSIAPASLPVTFTRIDRIRLDDGAAGLVDLVPRDYAWLMAAQDAGAVARPMEYCIYAGRIQLDSRPDRTYAVLIDGVQRLSTASAGTDSSAWFNDARRLVRARAKAELYAHVIKDSERAALQTAIEQREFRALKQKLNARNSGRVRPTAW